MKVENYYLKDRYERFKMGDIFDNRFIMINEFDYGNNSVIWLSYDLLRSEFVNIKMSRYHKLSNLDLLDPYHQ